jgi:DNA helicase HerA-like ATPase
MIVNSEADVPVAPVAPEAMQLGQVTSVRGSRISVGLFRRASIASSRDTVGNFMGIRTARSFLTGVITDVSANIRTAVEESGHYATARVDLVGEIYDCGKPTAEFRRGVSEYPAIDDPVFEIEARELQLIFNVAGTSVFDIGSLQQNEEICAYIDVDEMLTKHFAILGTTGVGKTSAVALTLQALLGKRPELRIFVLDVHNEYRRCFVDRAQILNPPNLRLPFWLFGFDELIDVLFSGRPAPDEEADVLSELIPLAKSMYQQSRQVLERGAKRGDRPIRYTVDTPVPYRMSDLLSLLNERVGKLENRLSRLTYSRLLNRIQTVVDDARYAFMFENANVGGDTMADVLAQLFRLRPGEQPMTIMQLAGFPAEVVDAVVSVVCRLAFDFGLWSEGAVPLLFVCEEAHRYAAAGNVGFAPTRRAISRIAREGRKYGVYLGLVTQRPAELDPTILSQCSTIFAMRMTNDRDQAILRSALSDTTADLLDFLPALATAEVFAFGEGVALPARIKLKSLPAHQLPRSEAIANVRDRFGADVDQSFIASVLDRWRTATSASKLTVDEVKQELRQAHATEISRVPVAPGPAEPGEEAVEKRPAINRADVYAAIKASNPGAHGR